MKNLLFPFTLATLLLLVLSGCQSMMSPSFRPVPEQAPVFKGDYFTMDSIDKAPEPMGFRRTPIYPAELKSANVAGSAIIAFIVTKNGTTSQIQVVSATHRGFADAAKEAIAQWRYRPAIKDGKPVNCMMKIPVAFDLAPPWWE